MTLFESLTLIALLFKVLLWLLACHHRNYVVIIYLLEDEQELSLGMLIRPKRIYNFCFLHACFVWLCHVLLELSYTFEPISTNLFTQCTQLPVSVFCCCCISGFPAIKSAPKILGKIYKKPPQQKLPESPREGRGVHHQAARRAGGAAPPWAAPGTLVTAWWVPSMPPFAYIYPSGWKPLISISFSQTPLCTAAAAVSISGLPGEAAPAPCRKEEPPPGDHP